MNRKWVRAREVSFWGFVAIGAISAALATWRYHSIEAGIWGADLCSLNEAFNCDGVMYSRRGQLADGLPLAAVAFGWFLALIAASVVSRTLRFRRNQVAADRVIFVHALVALGVSAFYLHVMISELRLLCLYCLAIDVALLGICASLAFSGPFRGNTGAKPLFAWGVGHAFLFLLAVASTFALTPELFASPGVDEIAKAVSTQIRSPDDATAGFPKIGPDAAPIRIVEFVDYHCPACGRVATTLEILHGRFPGKIQVVVKPFPSDRHCNPEAKHLMTGMGCVLAKAAFCAAELGRFQDFHPGIFRAEELSERAVFRALVAAGHTYQSASDCLNSPKAESQVRMSVADGKSRGVHHTPVIFINGVRLERGLSLLGWTRLVRKIIAVESAP